MSAKMNILVDGRVWSKNAAGITTFLSCALREWANQWKAAVFYVLLPKGMDPAIEMGTLPDNIRLLDYSGKFPRRLPNIVILQRLVPKLCKELKIDIYYSAVPHLPWGLPASVKTMVTVHDVVNIEMADTMAWTNRLASGLFFSKAIQKADFLWTNSLYTKSKVEQYFPNRRCGQIFVGDAADRTLFYPRHLTQEEKQQVRARYRIENKFILFVGSLEPRKNLSFLLELMPELYARHGVQLVVVGGKGWKNSAIKEVVEASSFPKQSTVFCGYISNEELAMLYNAADCFVSAALMEGFGMPQLEALLCGCPVVTADNTAMTEVASGKQGAVLVKEYKPADWIQAIMSVLESRPEVVAEQFNQYDWSLIIRQLTECITSKVPGYVVR